MLNKIIPDFLFDLQGAGEAFEDTKQMGLSGAQLLGEAKTKAPNSDYHKDEPPVAARQAEVARDYQPLGLAAAAGCQSLGHRSCRGCRGPARRRTRHRCRCCSGGRGGRCP